ncbi:hypothetical protein GF382_02270 [Candidatus Falkowbacteria bacterium]|nr:hypothetical protein [Candidatus Falkowbacteria bacterium]
MKLIIFAGGIGTRLWPLSRVNSPKQFDKIFNGKSTIQLAFERVAPTFGEENIFIQTGPLYKDLISEQLPHLPKDNIIIEPERKDLGAAVCLGMKEMRKRGHEGAVAILWSDHLMDRESEFIHALETAEELISEDSERFIFLGERPRFANNNLGWIKTGANKVLLNNFDISEFSGWKYRPAPEECDKMYKSGDHLWNPGYFITSVSFLLDCYKRLSPQIYQAVIHGKFEQSPAMHFDEAILEKIDLSRAVVIKTNMGWADPGTLYALKEALEEKRSDNVMNGRVVAYNCEDTLLYNLEKGKVMAAIGLSGIVAVNTEDALLLVHRDEVSHITKLVKKMREEGMEEYL